MWDDENDGNGENLITFITMCLWALFKKRGWGQKLFLFFSSIPFCLII
jgi:hypothetical protein